MRVSQFIVTLLPHYEICYNFLFIDILCFWKNLHHTNVCHGIQAVNW